MLAWQQEFLASFTPRILVLLHVAFRCQLVRYHVVPMSRHAMSCYVLMLCLDIVVLFCSDIYVVVIHVYCVVLCPCRLTGFSGSCRVSSSFAYMHVHARAYDCIDRCVMLLSMCAYAAVCMRM